MRKPVRWSHQGCCRHVLAIFTVCVVWHWRCLNFLAGNGVARTAESMVARPDPQYNGDLPNSQERPAEGLKALETAHSQKVEPAALSKAAGEPSAPLILCMVEERRSDGSTLLEKWFLEKNRWASEFETWRTRGLDAVSVLCQAAANQAEEIRCLECVGHVSDIPFPPSSPTLDAMVAVLQARLVTPWRNGSMRYCRTRVRASSEQAFCKAAAITVPA